MLKTRFAALSLACVMMLIASLSVAAQEQEQEEEKKEERTDPRLHFQIIPQQTVLLPGEPLRMTFILTNRSSDVITTREINIGRGDVMLWVSYEDAPFLKYKGNWGYIDTIGDRVKLKPGASIKAEAVVHFNHAQKSISDIIQTYYAFPEPGSYTLKARFKSIVSEVIYIHAEPVRIKVKELQGVDADVWERIRNDADVAYFIYADGKTFVDSEGMPKRKRGKRVVQTLNEILSERPNSSYSAYFKSALANYEKSMERWRLISVQKVESVLLQAGKYILKDDVEYGLGQIRHARAYAEEIHLLPKDLPQEPYIGLAYLFNKNYSKALDYLEPFITSGQTGSDSRVLIEAVAFIHLFYNREDRAADLLKITRSVQEQAQVMSHLRDRIQKRQPFTLEIYR